MPRKLSANARAKRAHPSTTGANPRRLAATAYPGHRRDREHHHSPLRYQFPSMEAGEKRPDTPAVAQATVRAAVDEARRHLGALPLFAGGKSFGGRMTSQAQAAQALPGAKGLVFVGYPLHPAGKPSTARADHLADVRVPMLFAQGTRDALADIALLREVLTPLSAMANLLEVAEADHSFHVLRRSGRTDDDVLQQLRDGMAAWMLAQR